MTLSHRPKIFWGLGVWVVSLALIVSLGCKGKGRISEKDLPLPPTVDGGVINGQFVQVDYGFGFPVPAKWIYTPLSAEQEVDEVARFTDPARAMLVRISVQMRDPSQKFSESAWSEAVELDLKNHQFQTLKKDGSREWKTAGLENWVMMIFHIKDGRNVEWVEEEWALPKDDLLIVAHASLPKAVADTADGKKLFKTIEGAFGQITWYLPIGTRGISVGRYELQHVTAAFAKALEGRSAAQVGNFFDEMYPDKGNWDLWYAKVTAGNPKNFELQVQLSGLVINGDYATASYTLIRKDKGDAKLQRFEKNFKLTKKEGSWKIAASIDKE